MKQQKLQISQNQIETALENAIKTFNDVKHITGYNKKDIESPVITDAQFIKIFTYTIIFLSILFIQGLGGFSSLSAIPLYFYETRYLCKEGNIFSNNCERNFLCSKSTIFNKDYKLDTNNLISLTSFISRYDIFCNNKKIVFLSTCYFIGGVIGTIIYPFIYNFLGLLNTILCSCLLYIFSSILLYPNFSYSIGSISYILNTISLVLFLLGPPQYISECASPNDRVYFFLFYFISLPLSGLLSTLIAYKTHDIKYIFLISSIICLLGLILGKIYLVESPRTCYIREKYDEFILNCEYISKINNSQIEFNLWKEENITKENKKDLNEKKKIENEIRLKKEFGNINYITIWKIPSQIKLLLLFCVASFIANYGLLLVQLEIKKQSHFFFLLIIAFCSDIIGFII